MAGLLPHVRLRAWKIAKIKELIASSNVPIPPRVISIICEWVVAADLVTVLEFVMEFGIHVFPIKLVSVIERFTGFGIAPFHISPHSVVPRFVDISILAGSEIVSLVRSSIGLLKRYNLVHTLAIT